MMEEIIQQGAEAILIRHGDVLLKRRVRKGYRLPDLDARIRKLRTRSEARLLEKTFKLISVPRVLKVLDFEIAMEFVGGKKLSESLDEMKNWREVCFEIGKNIALLHDAGIIHGDLTTSNMLWADGRLFFIDFGLGFMNGRTEDKAVDLYLIKEALEAKHFKGFEEYWKFVLKGYREKSKHETEVLKRLGKVEKRGRYKAQR